MSETTSALRDAWHRFECHAELMTTIDFGPDKIRVAPGTEDAWHALAFVFAAHGYLVRVEDTDSYCCRDIKGGSGRSLHSFGIALDVNWNTNQLKETPDNRPIRFSQRATQAERVEDVKLGRADTDMAPPMIEDVLAIKTKQGKTVFEWGGKWNGRKDPMHFELDLTPAELEIGIDWATVKRSATTDGSTTLKPNDNGSQVVRSDSVRGAKDDGALSRAVFFDAIRSSLFKGTLNQTQVTGTEALLDAWLENVGAGDLRWLAYILATVFHETGQRMVPVREGFAASDQSARAIVHSMFMRGRIKRDYAAPINGVSYFGRGRVQTTHLVNYQKLSQRFGLDFVGNPSLLLDSRIDAKVTIVGHIEGIWSGPKLADFIHGNRCDYEGARKIVNGVDRKEMIAGYANRFELALTRAAKPSAAARDTPTAPDHPNTTGIGEDPMTDADLAMLISRLDRLEAQNPPDMPASGPVAGGLTPVNGALGQTVGNMLDGKKSAIGIIGALATTILPALQGGSLQASIPAIASLAAATPVLQPIFLALSAWGVLGKMEKWSFSGGQQPK